MKSDTVDGDKKPRNQVHERVRTALAADPLWSEGSFGTTLAFVYRGDRHPTFDPSIVVAEVPPGGPDLSVSATSVELARTTGADGRPQRLTFIDPARTGSMTTEVIVTDDTHSSVQITACAAEGDVALIATACARIADELSGSPIRSEDEVLR